MFQPVLVTLSSKSDPLWRDYEQQCLNESQASVTAGAGPNLISPASFSSSQNPNEVDMILVKSENCSPSDFVTVFPDSSSSNVRDLQAPQKSSTTMWEDIASSIKKLDPDHADVLLEAAAPTLPPVSTVVSGNAPSEYYHTPQSSYSANFNDQDIFNNTGYCKKSPTFLNK